MRFNNISHSPARLARGTALVLLAGFLAGCSGDAMRVADLGLTTSATDNQRSIINGSSAPQPYPGDYGTTASAGSGAAPADLTYGSVSRSELPPPGGAPASEEPYRVASAASSAGLAAAGTGAVPGASGGAGGWSATGGTRVTLGAGETLYSLSRRYGVPVNEIMKANGIGDGNSVPAGAEILIPSYVYARNVPVSAPDNDPKVAMADPARSASRAPADRGPAERAPQPAAEQVAMVPKPNDLRDSAKAAGTGSSAPGTYKVVAGDTLHRIAQKHGVTTSELQRANGLDNGLIRVGQVLKIPGGTGGTTEVAASRPAAEPAVAKPAAAEKVKAEPAVVRKEEKELPQYTPPAKGADELIQNARVEAPDSTGVGKMRWPARGRVISQFGNSGAGRKNDGIDIAVPEGTSIRAAENGVVIYAGDSLKDFGNTVLLRHENGLVTVYGHASKLKVSRGDVVKRGDEIALSGVTGATDVPKLHFEVRKDSVPVNPMTYLQ